MCLTKGNLYEIEKELDEIETQLSFLDDRNVFEADTIALHCNRLEVLYKELVAHNNPKLELRVVK